MKTNTAKLKNKNRNNGDFSEEVLTRLLQEAYQDEVPALTEELVQKTLQRATEEEKVRKETCTHGIASGQAVTWFGKRNTSMQRIRKPYFAVGAACLLLLVCGKIVQENMPVPQKEACVENSMGMYSEAGDMAMVTEASGSSKEETEMWLESEFDALADAEENGGSVFYTEETDEGYDAVPEEKEASVLSEVLPMFPEELFTKEAAYTLWIDGVQAENGWETALHQALQTSPPQPVIEAETAAETFLEQNVLFTLIVRADETEYCLEIGAYTRVTIEQAREKRSVFFEIFDLTLYQEILTMKL